MNDRPLFVAFDPEPTPSSFRLLLAFLCTPVVSALVGAVVMPAMTGGSAPVAASALMGGIAGALVTLCGGVPAFWWLRRRGPISLAQTLCAGAALGNAPVALTLFGTGVYAVAHLAAGTISLHRLPVLEFLASVLGLLVMGTSLGTAAAAVFWFVAIRGTDLSQ